jgi:hypothetical protein
MGALRAVSLLCVFGEVNDDDDGGGVVGLDGAAEKLAAGQDRGLVGLGYNKTVHPWKWKYDADAEHARYLQRHPKKASVTQAA